MVASTATLQTKNRVTYDSDSSVRKSINSPTVSSKVLTFFTHSRSTPKNILEDVLQPLRHQVQLFPQRGNSLSQLLHRQTSRLHLITYLTIKFEVGCANCGLSFCSKCLRQRCKVPDRGGGDYGVCKICYSKLAAGSSNSQVITAPPPPDAYIK